MVRRRAILLGLLTVGIWWGPALAAPIPSPLQDVKARAVVARDSSTGIFTYRYRVVNPAVNDGQIWHVDIEITRGPGDVMLSREGLINGPGYARHSSEEIFQRIPMVPVGISGPQGWTSGLAYDDRTPARGFAAWSATYDPSLILPGQIRDGFELTSYGLPAVRTVEIHPDIDYDNLPDEYENPDKAKALRDSLIFRTKSVGPKAPSAQFVPQEFLNHLIALLHDSRQQGWVKVDGLHQSLLAKLLAAKRALEAGRTEPARNEVRAFINEVSGASCQDFSCPGNKPLTSEAYALLYFNGQYLVERLPAPGPR